MDKRRLARAEEKEREDEEMIRNNSLGELLETERTARAYAEERAETLARQRQIDTDKMKELEKIREQLEVLLEEEKQAKKDEEIVRTLQVPIWLNTISDPSARPTVLPDSSDHYSHLKVVLICKILKSVDGRTDRKTPRV